MNWKWLGRQKQGPMIHPRHRPRKHCRPMTRHPPVREEVAQRPRWRLRATACCPVLKCWQRPRLTVSDSPCGAAAEPDGAVTETSWAGCDVGDAEGCIVPCEGACEDRGDAPEAVGRRGCRGCWHRPALRLRTRSRNLAGSSSSPSGDGYKTKPAPPLFPTGGYQRGW